MPPACPSGASCEFFTRPPTFGRARAPETDYGPGSPSGIQRATGRRCVFSHVWRSTGGCPRYRSWPLLLEPGQCLLYALFNALSRIKMHTTNVLVGLQWLIIPQELAQDLLACIRNRRWRMLTLSQPCPQGRLGCPALKHTALRPHFSRQRRHASTFGLLGK